MGFWFIVLYANFLWLRAHIFFSLFIFQFVSFGMEILKVVPGRVSTEVDARWGKFQFSCFDFSFNYILFMGVNSSQQVYYASNML